MVQENARVRARIPDVFAPLMVEHVEKVDAVLSPGVVVQRWTSLGLETFLHAAHAALAELELLIERLIGLRDNRIEVLLSRMLEVGLCTLPVGSTLAVEAFVSATAESCAGACRLLDSQSHAVERAVLELLGLLLGQAEEVRAPDDPSTPGAVAAQRKVDLHARLQQEADSLLLMYEQQIIDTLVQLTKRTLEEIRRRLAITGLVYGDYEASTHKNDHPLFQADIALSLPSLVMRPSLDDIQQGLNRAVNMITSVTAKVYRWGQERVPVPPIGEKPLTSHSDIRSRSRIVAHVHSDATSLKNYHRMVSEHKEVAKLVSGLSSAINSTKTQVVQAIDLFSHHRELWALDRDEHMKTHSETRPTVNDYRADMQHYAKLEQEIMTGPEELPAGAILLSCEGLKISLCAEAKSWRVCFGRAMNHQYQTLMEEVFTSIDDWTKQLSRPLKDLDDIRSVMATLKDIRENEIRVDMSLEPIEVHPNLFHYLHSHTGLALAMCSAGVLCSAAPAWHKHLTGGHGEGRHTALHVAETATAGDAGTRYPPQGPASVPSYSAGQC